MNSCLDKNNTSFIEYNDYVIVTTLLCGSLFSYLFWLIVTYMSNENFNESSVKVNSVHSVHNQKLPPLDIKDPYYDKPMRVMGNSEIKMRVILVRHGQSQHNKNHDGKDGKELPDNPELDTCLTYDGIEQAEQVGNYLNNFKWLPDIIRISPMQRARQTAEPFMKKFFGISQLHKPDGNPTYLKDYTGQKTCVIDDDECMEVNTWCDQKLDCCGEYETKKETYEEFVERVKRWKKTLENDILARPTKRTQTLVFTHSMVISEFLNLIVSEKRENVSNDYWSKIYWQVNHCSITCLDFTENKEWHVQSMNYTSHLNTLTGVKSPFV